MAAMAGLAEFPDMVRSTFINSPKNDVGVYGVRFFIRGKPWVVSIDDFHMFRNPQHIFNFDGSSLKFAR